ncbi:MAG: arylsulfatase [Bacteroidota bacterium]
MHYSYTPSFVLPVLLMILAAGCQAPKDAIDPRKPNIVFILTDDQGWGDLSHNGNTNLETPNIDLLAQNGARFDRFFVSPVCSPTRAEILTGRYSVRGGVYSTSAGGERLDLDETTIADVFQATGYHTAAYGKWHNGMQFPYHPNGRGFDEYYGFASGHWGNYFSPMLEHNGQIIQGNGFVIDDFTEQAMSFMETHQHDPFFVYLPYNTPHSPMQVPDRWWDKFKDKELTLRDKEPDKENLLHTKAALAMCENIDWNVGRLVAKLQELSLEENTIIVYLSDNGPNGRRWNEGMKGRKGSTDEGGVRSPLVMQWKGQIEAGIVVPQIASTIDFLPTLADMAGIPYPTSKPLDGMSLSPLLLAQSTEWPERTLVNHWRGRTSIRTQQYRLGHDNLLFDMVQDPRQLTDISEQEPEVKERLLAFKEEWEATVMTELPKKDPRSFPLGHPAYHSTQVPARDGIAHGNIQRSNRWPNCSFFTHWTSLEDKITWQMEVAADGEFEVELYYTCPQADVGSEFELRIGDKILTGKITEAHDPPLVGMEEDRDKRGESYVKDFKVLTLGKMHLEKGDTPMTLQATSIPGSQVMDVRLLMFHRL